MIPAIALVVNSERPTPTGLAFVAGWLSGKAALTVLFVQAPRLLDGLDRPAPHWTAWVRIAAGVLCIAGGIWYSRRPPRAVQTPRWVARLRKITPMGAAAVGVALTVVNVKVLLTCAAAGFAIGVAHPGAMGTAAAVAYFTALAGSTAAVPILAYAVWAHRIDRHLARFNEWLGRRQKAITVALLAVIGIGLLYNGVGAL